MKKWIGAISSALVGIFSFIFLCLDWCVMKSDGSSYKYSGWDVIEGGNEFKKLTKSGLEYFDGYTFFKVCAIIMLVVAVIAILWAIVLVLNNLNVIKLNLNLNMINNIILSVLVLFVVLALVALAIMGADVVSYYDDMNYKVKCFASVGAWIQLVVAGLGCAAGWVFARKAE